MERGITWYREGAGKEARIFESEKKLGIKGEMKEEESCRRKDRGTMIKQQDEF